MLARVWGHVPNLKARGQRDGANYLEMERRGELKTYEGRTVPVRAFIADVRSDLAGVHVRQAVADAYRCGELRDTLPWPLTIVRSGMGPDGSQSVRSFQRLVLTRGLALREQSLSLAIVPSKSRRCGATETETRPSTGRGQPDASTY